MRELELPQIGWCVDVDWRRFVEIDVLHGVSHLANDSARADVAVERQEIREAGSIGQHWMADGSVEPGRHDVRAGLLPSIEDRRDRSPGDAWLVAQRDHDGRPIATT